MPPKEERMRPKVSGHIDSFPLLELSYPKNIICTDLFICAVIFCAAVCRNIIFLLCRCGIRFFVHSHFVCANTSPSRYIQTGFACKNIDVRLSGRPDPVGAPRPTKI